MATPFLPPVTYWDDDLERQLHAFATGAAVASPPDETPAVPAPIGLDIGEPQLDAAQPGLEIGTAHLAAAPGPGLDIGQPELAEPGTPRADEAAPVAAPADTRSPEMPVDYLGQPDAISGGADASQQEIERQVAAFARPMAGQTLGAPAMPDDYSSPEELGAAWSQLPIEEQEAQRSRIEGQRQALLQAGMVNADTQALKDAHANAEIYATAVKQAQQKQAQLDVEAQQLANEKIDPLRDISTGQKIAGVLAAFIGGFAMKSTGRNVGLEQIDAMINDSIQAQTANLNNRKDLLARRGNAIAEQLAMGKDLYQAQETVRLATYDQLARKLETEVQQFDPRGTRALRTMDTINAIKARRAALLAKYQTEQQKAIEAALKEQRERAQLLETQRHNLAGEKNDATRAYADLLRAKNEKKKTDAEVDATTFTPEQLGQLYGVQDPALLPPVPMSRKDYDKFLETKKKAGDATKIAQETAPEERERELGIGEIVDDKGDAVKFRNPDFAGKLANSKAAVDNAARLIDKLILARRKYGWSSDLVKSPEWREMQADYTALQLEKKNTDELGVLAGPDMSMIEKSLGTKDPTELRDPTPGLQAARSNIVEQFNAKVRAQAVLPKGRNVTRYEPPDMTNVGDVVPTAGEATVQSIIEYDPDARGPQSVVRPGTLTDELRSNIDKIIYTINSPAASDKDRDYARAYLLRIQNEARSGAVRKYATDAALHAAMGSSTSPEEIEP